MDEIRMVGGMPRIGEVEYTARPKGVVGRTISISVDREVMSRLMKKGEAYSQIKQYVEAQEADSMTLAKIRELIKTTEMMME